MIINFTNEPFRHQTKEEAEKGMLQLQLYTVAKLMTDIVWTIAKELDNPPVYMQELRLADEVLAKSEKQMESAT